jgi:hypothetical protein
VKFLHKNGFGKINGKNLKPVMVTVKSNGKTVTVMVKVKRFYHFTISITVLL